MKTMFSGNQQKSVPKSFEECYKQDAVSTNLWAWGERLEKLGKILFIALIIVGIMLSITSAFHEVTKGTYYTYTDTEFDFWVFIETLITYAIYAFLEYCAYHVLALVICSLASIVQNNNIVANTALYNSKEYKAEEISSQNSEAKSVSGDATEKKSKIDKSKEYCCPKCSKIIYYGKPFCPNCGQILKWDNI